METTSLPKTRESRFKPPLRRALGLTLASFLTLSPAAHLVWAGPPFAEFIDPHPAPGNQFGHTVLPLSTGNVVITSPYDDAGGTNAGAVYLFSGATGALISTLTGSHADDNIGIGGVKALTNGNYVIGSWNWNSWAGAVTWGSGRTGVSGVVSSSNSLVGSSGDRVGTYFTASLGTGYFYIDYYLGVTALPNGNYVVRSWNWHDGPANAAAVTWGNGSTGTSGVVGPSNSLIASSRDFSWQYGPEVTVLANGNYVVSDPSWRPNDSIGNAGAVTFGSGASGVSGRTTASNSLIGSRTGDRVGGSVTALTNGNYVVGSPDWSNGSVQFVGAATWGSGTTGITGPVSTANSLVGATANDAVGRAGVTALSNGNFVVLSPAWFTGAATAGAATWGNGASGLTGVVSASNSLIGSKPSDQVGWSATALTNGHYVVLSPYCANGAAASAGAVTWGDGVAGTIGTTSPSNSLVGSQADDLVGVSGITALTNGNYVVNSSAWANGSAKQAGAATWGDGSVGISGAVTPSNSLVGSTAQDRVGYLGATELTNGNYVVVSKYWTNGGATQAGAVTWASGTAGVSGPVGASNSLVGSSVDDYVGNDVRPLANGNYVVGSPSWDDGAAANAGAATWGDGTSGISGPVSAANSLVGLNPGDFVGEAVTALGNGNYLVSSSGWDNGAATGAGAVTWGSGATGAVGPVTASNSLVGSTESDHLGFYSSEMKITIYSVSVLVPSVVAFPNGSYIVRSPDWDNAGVSNAGAATWGDGTSAITGTVNSSNSLMGGSPNSDLRSVVADGVNGTLIASFLTEGGGRVRLVSQTDGLAPTTVSIDDATIAEGGAGKSIVAFTVSLSSPSAVDVTVNYATSDGTATAGEDYKAASGAFTIPAGRTSKQLTFLVNGDATSESDETFTVTLSDPTGVTLGTSSGTGTILNDDAAVTATPVTQYRLYHDGTKEHLYTTDLNEYNVLGGLGWAQEGVAYKMLTNGVFNGTTTTPLFRLYHPGVLQHHWTTDSNEAMVLAHTPYWFYEGTIGYLLPTQVNGTVPLYRMSLASPPLHLWTTDQNEYEVLATRGWVKEGIIGYVVP